MFLQKIRKLINIGLILENRTVPEEKIRSRYYKALNLIPELVKICDIVRIYDNTVVSFRKRKDVYFHWENRYWVYSRVSPIIK